MSEANQSDDSTIHSTDSVSSNASQSAKVCYGLRRSASKAIQQLASVKPKSLPSVVPALLADVGRRMGAEDVHLFRIRLDGSGTGFAGLRYRSREDPDADRQVLVKKFQFQLFSSEIQRCLRRDEIAVLGDRSKSGGRVLAALLRRLKCDRYILCPLHIDGVLRGALGIACPRPNDSCDGREFFELLRLNGVILLSQILRVRRQRKRSLKLRNWRRIANQACDFAFRVDEGGFISGTTPFGMGNDTPPLNGLRLVDVVARNFQPQLAQQISTAGSSGQVRTCDLKLSLGSAGPQWYHARIEPCVRTSDGVATLYLTDNSPDKILEEEVRELRDQLLKASHLSLLGQMSTEFAHQLNQPLQVMLNHCNTAQRRIRKQTDKTAQTLRSLDSIEDSIMHAADTINRVRDFVKFRSLKTEPVPLDELIAQALAMVTPTARGRDADLLPPATPSSLTVMVDRTQTLHVLVNLMINALEACDECPDRRTQIKLSWRDESNRNRAVVGVSDNGPGLPVGDPDVVFRKFYTGKDEGLGMGLSISRSVCESQNGSLVAENHAGKPGCTFHVAMVIHGNSENETIELATLPPSPLPVD